MTAIDTKKLRELAAKATQVVNWYAYGPYDGYHPGKGSVRGPFCRWLLVQEGGGWDESKPKPVADVEDDAKFAAAAMNNLVQLLDEIDRQNELLAVAKASLEFYAQPDVYEERITFKGTRPAGVLAESGDFARAALKRMGEGK